MDSKQQSSTPSPPEQVVSDTIKEGFENIAIQTGVGLGVGFLAGLVLTRGGSGSARKIVTGFGGGAGLGSAWTKCSIKLEETLNKN